MVKSLNTIFDLLSIATDIATGSSHNKLKRVTDDIETWTVNQTKQSINYSNEMIRLENKKAFWQNKVLRKTTFYIEDEIAGILFIPVISKAKFVKLHIFLNGRDFVFL